MVLLFNHNSTAHVRTGIQIQLRNTPILQLASFEDTFTQGMRLEIQMQTSAAKQSFSIIFVIVGKCSGIIW